QSCFDEHTPADPLRSSQLKYGRNIKFFESVVLLKFIYQLGERAIGLFNSLLSDHHQNLGQGTWTLGWHGRALASHQSDKLFLWHKVAIFSTLREICWK